LTHHNFPLSRLTTTMVCDRAQRLGLVAVVWRPSTGSHAHIEIQTPDGHQLAATIGTGNAAEILRAIGNDRDFIGRGPRA
jgi:hypothetical protein